MTSFPSWLDRATLEWAADYCHQMSIRLADIPSDSGLYAATGADVCARGLRNARSEVERQQRGALSGMAANVAAAIKANRDG